MTSLLASLLASPPTRLEPLRSLPRVASAHSYAYVRKTVHEYLLTHSPASTEDIHSATGICIHSIRRALRELQSQGKVLRSSGVRPVRWSISSGEGEGEQP